MSLYVWKPLKQVENVAISLLISAAFSGWIYFSPYGISSNTKIPLGFDFRKAHAGWKLKSFWNFINKMFVWQKITSYTVETCNTALVPSLPTLVSYVIITTQVYCTHNILWGTAYLIHLYHMRDIHERIVHNFSYFSESLLTIHLEYTNFSLLLAVKFSWVAFTHEN